MLLPTEIMIDFRSRRRAARISNYLIFWWNLIRAQIALPVFSRISLLVYLRLKYRLVFSVKHPLRRSLRSEITGKFAVIFIISLNKTTFFCQGEHFKRIDTCDLLWKRFWEKLINLKICENACIWNISGNFIFFCLKKYPG